MRWLVDVCYLLAAVLLLPVVIYRALTTGKYRRGWIQRLGGMPILPPDGRRVWIHAVSVGEINAVRGLVEMWREGSDNTELIISTTTDTGYARARQLFPDLLVIRYPLDISWFVRRGLKRIAPSMVVLVELEVWYQFVTQAAKMEIPVAVINGRLSETSIRRFKWIKPIARQMFESLTWIGAQDKTYANRFCLMGVPAGRVTVTGSMKWDGAQITDYIEGTEELARAMGCDRNRPTWVCGSTGPGEEKLVLDAFGKLREKHQNLQLAVVPRKPERFGEVADLIVRSGFDCIRRSDFPDGKACPPLENSVMLGDTMGELRKFYLLADVVFVGRTLARMGGSDMMEVAGLAKPIIVGSHTENFADTMRQLEEGNAILVASADLENPEAADILADAVGKLLDDPVAARGMGDNGREVVKKNRGATERTLDTLMEIMRRAEHSVT
ncbi:MAG: 3-deoxy-D-manno-octulosonic acid transferase [Planctomycetota bacterium]|nr:MAG: 3-deoxy-D-manno-octulosonic acid transferase [Planctomycetota bacterium]